MIFWLVLFLIAAAISGAIISAGAKKDEHERQLRDIERRRALLEAKKKEKAAGEQNDEPV